MRSTRLPLLLGLAMLAFVGCGDEDGLTSASSTSDLQLDEQAINSLMTDESDYFGSGEAMSDNRVEVGSASGKQSPSGAPIESFYFIREITERDIHRDIQIENPSGRPAVATVQTVVDLRGIFHLFYDDPDSIYLPGVIDKRLNATATHNAVFVRRLEPSRRHRGWRLVEVSGVEIVSNPATKQIRSLEIESSSVTMTITDPLELVPVRELPTFEPGERVTLRVTTGDETDYVFLHTPFLKDEFEPLGGGVFEGTWSIGHRRGARRFAVDVIDEETLFDDEAPYDSAAWAFHYRVLGEPRAEFEDS